MKLSEAVSRTTLFMQSAATPHANIKIKENAKIIAKNRFALLFLDAFFITHLLLVKF
jgi:hypothetical protein